MPRLNPEVTAYIADQPAEKQAALNELRAIIRAAYPKASEEMYEVGPTARMATGFPVYKSGEEWLGGFANRRKGPMAYLTDQAVVDKYRDQLGTLAQGKGCVLYKPTRTLDAAALKQLFQQMYGEAAARRV
jgi:uncharacterized protein YdhG (YjbR/CyaY superfamily)